MQFSFYEKSHRITVYDPEDGLTESLDPRWGVCLDGGLLNIWAGSVWINLFIHNRRPKGLLSLKGRCRTFGFDFSNLEV